MHVHVRVCADVLSSCERACNSTIGSCVSRRFSQNKPAYQSSNLQLTNAQGQPYYPVPATKAVDGDTTQTFSGMTCSSTVQQQKPWW